DWPGLSIEPLIAPEDLRLLIGWTGSPASTSDLVDQVHRSREDKMVAYQLFLKNSTECVNEMIKGFKENNVTLIQQMIRKNRQLLHDLSAITGVVI
ncbi:phosphomevalonate kinase, partial [Enterococcus faecium]|nr:phosphomevalonate kinase [Enterococcus faecium]